MKNMSNIITMNSDGSQVVEYNNPLFECFAIKTYCAPNQTYHITEHWHEDLEYIYVIDGELEYNVNGKSIMLRAGEDLCQFKANPFKSLCPREVLCFLLQSYPPVPFGCFQIYRADLRGAFTRSKFF